MRCPDRRLRGRAGFTLLEVTVALAVGALLLLAARALVEQVGDSSERTVAGALDNEREQNAERTLRELVGRMEISAQPARGLDGTPQLARFDTWCDVPAGWQERCSASLGFVAAGSGNALALEYRGAIEVVRRSAASGALLYLTSAEAGGQWVPAWRSSVELPLAVGVVLGADTLVLRIGERG